MLRCAKNNNGVIIAMGNDQGQSGHYPNDSQIVGTWCSWVVDPSSLPVLAVVTGLTNDQALTAMRFKENAAGNGIELRTDAEVLASPQG